MTSPIKLKNVNPIQLGLFVTFHSKTKAAIMTESHCSTFEPSVIMANQEIGKLELRDVVQKSALTLRGAVENRWARCVFGDFFLDTLDDLYFDFSRCALPLKTRDLLTIPFETTLQERLHSHLWYVEA